jgi:hypothetical protein
MFLSKEEPSDVIGVLVICKRVKRCGTLNESVVGLFRLGRISLAFFILIEMYVSIYV